MGSGKPIYDFMASTISPLVHSVEAIKWGKFQCYSGSLWAELLKVLFVPQGRCQGGPSPRGSFQGWGFLAHPPSVPASFTLWQWGHCLKCWKVRRITMFVCDMAGLHQQEKIRVAASRFRVSAPASAHRRLGQAPWARDCSLHLALPSSSPFWATPCKWQSEEAV